MPNSERLEDKFEYFYRPYNYLCNSQKYINFAENEKVDPFARYRELISEEHFIDIYLKSHNIQRSKSEP